MTVDESVADQQRWVAPAVDEIDPVRHLGWSVLARAHAYDVTETLDDGSERLRATDRHLGARSTDPAHAYRARRRHGSPAGADPSSARTVTSGRLTDE